MTVKDKKIVLSKVLDGLHDNMVNPDLKNLGIKTPFGKMQSSSGITLSPNAVLIFQSPTGLFEKRVRIADL